MLTDNRARPELAVTTAVGERVALLLATVQAFAELDFSHRARVGDEGDDLDALAAGINMLGEEIDAAQQALEDRVTERDSKVAELAEIAGSLEQEVGERRRMELALRGSNESLSRSIRELQQVNREIAQLTEMSNLFQVCRTRDEAFTALAQLAGELFPQTSGNVFVYVASRDVLEAVTGWGSAVAVSRTITPDRCWALRRGRLHRSGGVGLRCAHLSEVGREESLCVPLSAQGETLGLLHLNWPRLEREGSDGENGTITDGYERVALAASEQIALALANVELRAALRAQSIRDPLTGLYNRRFLDETLARELRRSHRDGSRVSFLMLDVDHFKLFNDEYGHEVGDDVLRQVAVLIRDGTRGEDIACRYGGEEFSVVMCGPDSAQVGARAEEIRRIIATTEFDWHGQPTRQVTVSIGIALYPANADSREELVRAADRALYDAKHSGRDRVVVSMANATTEPVPEAAADAAMPGLP